jgi:hypothetical protein
MEDNFTLQLPETFIATIQAMAADIKACRQEIAALQLQQGAEWLKVTDYATKSGLNPHTIRRMCMDNQLVHKLTKPTNGQYLIHSSNLKPQI